jgi:hypothetical protein
MQEGTRQLLMQQVLLLLISIFFAIVALSMTV